MNQSAMVTVPCLVMVAAGVLAPGHLGELTRYLPFELVDDVLAMTCWLGGAGRFSSARKAVRFAGLDVTVYSSYAEDDVKPGNPAPALSGLGLLMSFLGLNAGCYRRL